MSFHEIRFPTDISLASEGGPERRTEIVVLGSGHEERNSRWAESRRRYNAGYGVKSLDDLHAVISFFEERRGRLYGFRWKDWTDFKSCAPSGSPSALDQVIGTGTGTQSDFQLAKRYGSSFAPYTRDIQKPVSGTVLVAVNGAVQTQGTAYTVDYTTGLIHFLTGHIPSAGAAVTAGFEFDVPVRFENDKMMIDLKKFNAGSIQTISILEVRL